MLLNVRHQRSAAHIGNYLEYQNFQYDQWRYILKVLYKKVGLFKEAMDLRIKVVCFFNISSEFGF